MICIQQLWCLVLVGFFVASLVSSQCLTDNDTTHQAENTVQEYLNDGQMDFSLSLYKNLMSLDPERNSFYSPESVSQALKMAFFGAAGGTEEELRHILNFGTVSKSDIMKHFRFQNLWRILRAENATYTLDVANRLYFEKDLEVRECIQQLFPKEIQMVDFKNKAEEIRLDINTWVEETTHGKIKDLVGAGDINVKTLIALVNSAYFNGTWLYQFKPTQTKVQTFYKNPSNFSHVKMMHLKGNFKHSASEELQANVLELPYEGKDISMIILLPPFKDNSLEETISRLNSTTLKEAISNGFRQQVEVSLPKFRIEHEFQMREVLSAMGAGSMFNSVTANFTDFTTADGVFFGSAIHKAFVEVDERGTEAAAATALVGFRSARPLSPLKFTCDHPFLFLIYDNTASTILFIGAIKDPKALSAM